MDAASRNIWDLFSDNSVNVENNEAHVIDLTETLHHAKNVTGTEGKDVSQNDNNKSTLNRYIHYGVFIKHKT